ncbi:MAG: efflux RND transporter periplasmic adaptor subunit [Planctomycetaceae bacterium]
MGSSSAGGVGAGGGAGVPQAFRVKCRNTALAAKNEQEQHLGLAAVVVAELGVDRVVLVRRPEGSKSAEVTSLAPQGLEALDESLGALLVEVAAAACSTGVPQVGRHAEGRGWYAVGASIPGPSHAGTAWVALFKGDVRRLPMIAESLQCALESFAFRQHASPLDVEAMEVAETSRLTAAVIDLIGRVQRSESSTGARETLVRELATFLGDGGVLLAVPDVPGGPMSVVVGSSAEFSLSDSDLRQGLNWAADESVLRGELSVWPASDDGARHALMAHRHVSELADGVPVLSVPLVDGRQAPTGVLLLLGQPAVQEDVQRVFTALAGPVASCLEVWKRTEKGWLLRSIDRTGAALWRAKGVAIVFACLLLIGAMFVPMTYHVRCECEVQPAARRYAAAQFEGTLERAFVEPGDVVEAGQLLARLDGRELRWELSGLEADLNRAATERAGHMAVRDPGKARIAALEVERLELKTQLLDHRIEHLEVRSPVHGIVITGDLKKSEGIPVKNGQTLFEIAPLDRVTLDVRIPNDEVAHVAEQMTVEVTLEAYPERTWSGTIRRIHPRSETKDRLHFFVAEVELDNPESLLRPGMEGRAYVTTDKHPLGWNLFHRAWYRTLMWSGW